MKQRLALIGIFILGLILRSVYFNDITFGYDQARDAFQAIEIWESDPIKIIGPKTDFTGLHHGPLYWYLISPVYHFSGGDVQATKIFLIFLNLLGVFVIFDLTNLLFKNQKIALLTSFFYAISFELTQYARWLSNPAPAVLTTLVSFWSLWRFIKGQHWALIPLVASWGLSVQFEFFMLYQIVVFILIWLLIKGKQIPKITTKELILSLIALIATVGSFLAAEIKFNFQGTKALISFFKTQQLFNSNFSHLFIRYLDRFTYIFFLNLWGVNLFLAGLLAFATIYLAIGFLQKETKEKNQLIFLIAWIISPMLLHFFTGTDGLFLNLGAGSGAIILTSWLLVKLTQKTKPIFLATILIIIVGNLGLIFNQNKNGEVLFSVQERMVLSDELEVIDWIYQQAQGRPFYLNTITNPLFINTTWAYLFDWYGKKKYGYMPIWWGETQVNVYGDQVAFSPPQNTTLHFLIIEPGPGIPQEYIFAIQKLENSRSRVVQKKHFGNFKVEKRIITKPRIFTSQDVFSLL